MLKKSLHKDFRLDVLEDLDVFDRLERAAPTRRTIEITPLRAAELALSARRLAEVLREEAEEEAKKEAGE